MTAAMGAALRERLGLRAEAAPERPGLTGEPQWDAAVAATQERATLRADERAGPPRDDEKRALPSARRLLEASGERQGEGMVPQDAARVGGENLRPRGILGIRAKALLRIC